MWLHSQASTSGPTHNKMDLVSAVTAYYYQYSQTFSTKTHSFHLQCIELNNLPTPYRKIILKKLLITQLVKKFTIFYGIQRSITMVPVLS
jgi:hypothetical protein